VPQKRGENVSDANREVRIQELRNLVKQGEYQIDPQQIAARLLAEHLVDTSTAKENTLSVAASAPNPMIAPK
jgi:hypothetical protein